MSLTSQLTTIRLFTAADPYNYTVDNIPLSQVSTNLTTITSYVDKMHPGRVDVTGAATPTVNAVPSGWTVTRTGTGVYTITHNLNLAANGYSVLGSCYSAAVFYASALGANSFVANTVNFSGTAVDVQFVCELTEI